MEGVDRLYDVFAEELEDLVAGELRVATGDAGALYVFPGVLKRLRDGYPGIRATVRPGVLDDGLASLRDDEVDLVFGAFEPPAEEFEYRPVLSYDVVLITSPDHPLAGRNSVSPEEIAACPVIVPDVGTYSLRSASSPLRQLGIEANAVIEVGRVGRGRALRRSRARGRILRIVLRRRDEPGLGGPARPVLFEAQLRLVHAARETPVVAGRASGRGDGDRVPPQRLHVTDGRGEVRALPRGLRMATKSINIEFSAHAIPENR